MAPSSVEADFRRWRDAGDAEALGRVFDALAPKLLLVAAHLTRDAHGAEDLLQTAFLEALRDARSWDGRRELLPWLCGILAHRALDERRRAGRVEPRGLAGSGALDRPASGLDPAELAADRELLERIAGAVDALDEPYRSVLALRLAHGLAPAEIAHALGRSPGTVRVQLARGLERLREALPRSVALPAFLYGELGRGLGAVREACLGNAGPAAGAAAGAGSGAASATAPAAGVPTGGLGGLVAMKTTAIGAAAALGLVAVLWSWNRGDGERDAGVAALERAAPAPLAEPAELRSPGVAEAAPPERAEAAREAIAAPRGAPAGLTVRVVRAVDGAPAAGVGVDVRPAEGRSGPGVERRTDAQGVARFEALAPGRHAVDLDRWDAPARTVDAGRTAELVLELPLGCRVEGEVVDLEGRPVPGATIHRTKGDHPDLLRVLGRADALGRFALEDVAPRSTLVARAQGWQPSGAGKKSRVQVGEAAGQVARVVLTMGARGQRLQGRVVDPSGAPSPHALVTVAFDEDAREELEGKPVDRRLESTGRKALDLEAFVLRGGADGVFTTDEVPAGRTTVLARALADESLVGWALVDVVAGRDAAVEVGLRPGAEVAGTVTDPGGRPLAGVEVASAWNGTRELGQTSDDHLGSLATDRATRTAEDGAFLLVGLLPGEHDVSVRFGDETGARQRFELLPGERAAWHPSVEPRASLAVRVVGPDGEPLAGWGVTLNRDGRQRRPDHGLVLATDAGGRARFDDLEPRAFALAVLAPPSHADGRGTVALVRDDAVPAPEPYLLRVPARALPTASLVGSVGMGGAARPDATLRLARESPAGPWETGEHVALDGTGRFAFEPLPPGAYVLDLRRSGEPQWIGLGRFDLAPDQRLDVGVLTPDPAVPLRVALRVDDGGPIREPRVWAVHGEDRFLRFRPDGESGVVWSSAPLVPGLYRVHVEGEDVAPAVADLEVGPGGPAVHELVCARGVEQEFRIALPDDPQGAREEPDQARLHVTVWDEEDRSVFDDRLHAPYLDGAHSLTALSVRLRPGSYRARIEDHRRGSWSGAFVELDFEVGPPVTVRFD